MKLKKFLGLILIVTMTVSLFLATTAYAWSAQSGIELTYNEIGKNSDDNTVVRIDVKALASSEGISAQMFLLYLKFDNTVVTPAYAPDYDYDSYVEDEYELEDIEVISNPNQIKMLAQAADNQPYDGSSATSRKKQPSFGNTNYSWGNWMPGSPGYDGDDNNKLSLEFNTNFDTDFESYFSSMNNATYAIDIPEGGLPLYSLYFLVKSDKKVVKDTFSTYVSDGINGATLKTGVNKIENSEGAIFVGFPQPAEPEVPGVGEGGNSGGDGPATDGDGKSVSEGGLGRYITVKGKANNFTGAQGAGAVIYKVDDDEYKSDINAATFKQFFPAKQLDNGAKWDKDGIENAEISNWNQSGAFAVTLAGIEDSNYSDGKYWVATYQLVDGIYKIITGSEVSFNKQLLIGEATD